MEVGDMDDKSGTSTPKKVVIDTFNKSSEYLDFTPITTAELGKGLFIVWNEKGQTDWNSSEGEVCTCIPGVYRRFRYWSWKCECCSYLKRLITLLKEEVKECPGMEKDPATHPGSRQLDKRRTNEELSGTEHVVKQARKLKKEKGILANPDPKRGRPLSQEIVERVQEFNQSDDFPPVCVHAWKIVLVSCTKNGFSS